eukprot:m.629806 g.629806  ORF g.629806 m.629806 type:complete len:988 (+) comp22562_c1_seq5:179-3142(+)
MRQAEQFHSFEIAATIISCAGISKINCILCHTNPERSRTSGSKNFFYIVHNCALCTVNSTLKEKSSILALLSMSLPAMGRSLPIKERSRFGFSATALVAVISTVSCESFNCPANIPQSVRNPLPGDEVLNAFVADDKSAIFDRYTCLQALYPEETVTATSKVNPWIISGPQNFPVVNISNGWCGPSNFRTAVCNLSVTQACDAQEPDSQQSDCESTIVPTPLCPASGLALQFQDFYATWRDAALYPEYSSPLIQNSNTPNSAARFAIFSIVPLDQQLSDLETYFNLFLAQAANVRNFFWNILNAAGETQDIYSCVRGYVANVSEEEGQYFLNGAMNSCISSDLATTFNNCVLTSSTLCVPTLVTIARKIANGGAGVPDVQITAPCTEFKFSIVVYQYVCDDATTDAPVVRVSDVDRRYFNVPLQVINVDISHKCFCNNTSLDECSAVRMQIIKQQQHDSLIKILQSIFVALPPLCVLGILVTEFKHKNLLWQWRQETEQSNWKRFKSLVTGVAGSIRPLHLLTSQLSREHIVQVVSVWLLLFTIILFIILGIETGNEWVFAYEVMAFYIPLTLCAASSMRIHGGIVGFGYTAFLTYFLATLDAEDPNASVLEQHMHDLNTVFVAVPLSVLMLYFADQIIREYASRKVSKETFTTAFNVEDLANKWYYKYVQSVYNKSGEIHIPGSARLVLAIAVSLIALSYITSLVGLVLDEFVTQIINSVRPSCAADDYTTYWDNLSENIPSNNMLGLSCSTLRSLGKILRGTIICLWLLGAALAVVEIRLLYKHYQQDLASVIRGKFDCFPKKKIPHPVLAVLSSLNFVGFHTVAMLLLVMLIQRLIVGYAILEDKKHSVQLRYPRRFEYTDFLLIAFGVLSGVFKFLSRAAISMAINLAHLLRADAAVVPRGFEHYDAGYRSYAGMLAVDRFYNNPYVLLAVDFFKLVAHRNMSRSILQDNHNDLEGTIVHTFFFRRKYYATVNKMMTLEGRTY